MLTEMYASIRLLSLGSALGKSARKEGLRSPVAGGDGVLEFTVDSGDACQSPGDLISALACRNQFRYRLAMLGDSHRQTALRDLVHHRKTLRLELCGGHLLHD